jgi:hypothetical protein
VSRKTLKNANGLSRHDLRIESDDMLASCHDYYLVKYSVDCEMRQVVMRVRKDWDVPKNFRTIVFDDVEGYRFENDNFGNIIFSLETIPIKEFLNDYASELDESFRMSGAPRFWPEVLASEGRVLSEKGIKPFILASSYGLSGWILAKHPSVFEVEPTNIDQADG